MHNFCAPIWNHAYIFQEDLCKKKKMAQKALQQIKGPFLTIFA